MMMMNSSGSQRSDFSNRNLGCIVVVFMMKRGGIVYFDIWAPPREAENNGE